MKENCLKKMQLCLSKPRPGQLLHSQCKHSRRRKWCKILSYLWLSRCFGHDRRCNGRVFIESWRGDPPLNFREKFRVSPRTILKKISLLDTQTAVLVSTAEVWISAHQIPKDQFFLVFWVYAADFSFFFLPGDIFWVIFLRCLSPKKLGSQHQLRVKTRQS